MDVERDLSGREYPHTGDAHDNRIWQYICHNDVADIEEVEIDTFVMNVYNHYSSDLSGLSTILVAHQGNSDYSTHRGFIARACDSIQYHFGDAVQSLAINQVVSSHLDPTDLRDFAAAVPSLDIFANERYPIGTSRPTPGADTLDFTGNDFQDALESIIIEFDSCRAVFEASGVHTEWHQIIQTHEAYEYTGGRYSYHRRPTESEIFCQANLALSRGAKGIHTYIYSSNVDNINTSSGDMQFIGLVNNDTSTTRTTYSTYTHVANLFTWLVDSIGPKLLDKTCTASFNCNNIPATGQYITDVTGYANDGATHTIEISTYEDATYPSRDYFMLVNRLCSSDNSGTTAAPQVITLETTRSGAAWRITDVVTGETYISYDGDFPNIVIGPGRARLFEMCQLFETSELWQDSVHIYCDCTLPADRILNIQSGSVIAFDPVGDNSSSGRDTNRSELTIYGKLLANDVTFTSPNATTNDWYGIVLNEAHEESEIRDCTIEYGIIGVLCLYLDSDVDIRENTFSYCADQAIWIDHSDIDVVENVIENGSRYGIYVANASPYIYDNVIQDNAHYGVFFNYNCGGYIRENIIDNNLGGVRCANGASPLLIDRSYSKPGGKNKITGNTWWGVCPSDNSFPDVGNETDSTQYNAALNDIYNNGISQIRNNTSALVKAYQNYWACANP